MKTKIYFLTLLFFSLNSFGQGFELVKNINSDQFNIANSDPSNLFTFGNKLLFGANDGDNGKELWLSDGTTAGTILLKDIAENTGNSNPHSFIEVNGLVYFIAGGNIWQTDGTANGTIEYLSLEVFENDSNISDLAYFNGRFYFNMNATNDNISIAFRNKGNEIWSTDGTSAGTTLLKNIHPSANANPNNFYVFNNKLYFTASNISGNEELWQTDGTENNTIQLKDIFVGSQGSFPSSFTTYNNRLYFSAKSAEFGRELWSTNGESDDTRLEKDINPNSNDSNPSNLIIYKNKLFFSAIISADANNDVETGKELWTYDATTQEATLFKDIYEGSLGSFPGNFIIIDEKLYFSAIETYSGNTLTRNRLYVSDGTTDGTQKVVDSNNNEGIAPTYLAKIDNTIFFSGYREDVGFELFSYTTENIVSNPNTTFVPDDAFEQYLINQQLDDVLDNQVLTANINTITSLDLIDLGIEDLTGIEDFVELTSLDVNKNLLSEINITTLTKLNYLNINENNFTTLNISNSSLTNLVANDNKITSISIANLPELNALLINGNQISSINLSENNKLRYLYASDNKLTGLDVSNNDFTYLYINHNEITELDVSTNLNLEKLNCSVNKLTTLDLSSNTKLTELHCLNNLLSNLNIQNGNNANFGIFMGARIFNSQGNPNLSCIQVDDVNFATNNFTDIDETTSFSTDCSADQGLTFVPDDNFEQALIDLGLDTTLDNYVTTATIEVVTSLDVSDKQISDVTGLEAFTALQTLNISNNNLSSLNTAANTSLQNLNCSQNVITNLNILENASLLELNASNNQLTTVETYASFDLQRLEISNNKLENLVLSGNYALVYADCSFNKIKSLEVFNNFNLTDFIVNNNEIKKLELNGLTNLNTLTVNDNHLFALSLSSEGITSFNALNNNNLFCIEVDNVTYAETNFINKDAQASFNLNCNFNEATFVPDDLFEQALIDLGYDDFLDDYVATVYLKNLKTLTLENINIDDLTGLEAFVSLENLTLINLSIDEIDLSTLTKLKELNLFRNRLPQLDVTKNEDLEILLASENALSSIDLSKNINLQRLNLNYNEFKSTIDLSTNAKLQFFDILGNAQGNQITSIDFSNNPLLEEVQIQENLLTAIDVSSNLNLKRLAVPNNNISIIDVSNNTLLESLGVDNNNLSSLTVKANEQLQSLFTEGNNLTCVSVFDVDFANTQFTQFADDSTIFVSNCDNLVAVPDPLFEQALIDLRHDFGEINGYVDINNIKDVTSLEIENINIDDLTGLEAFTNLETLILKDLSIDAIDLSTLTKLKHLNLFRNLLQQLDVTKNVNLTELYASENSLSILDLSENKELQRLNLQYNDFTDIDISNNTKLVFFDILGNELGNQLTEIDITKNILLEELLLQGNLLTSIDVSQNTKLLKLSVSDNKLSTINLNTNKALETLTLTKNRLTSLRVHNNRFLKTLNISENQLSILNLINNIRLTTFNAKSNNLNCINVFDVDFANANWANNIDETATFGTDCYTAIPDANFEQALIDKGFDTVLDGYIVTSVANNVTFLGLATSNIEDLTGIEAFTALTGLTLKGNNLTSINLSNNTQLKTLNAIDNQLDRLDISNNTSLTDLQATSNNLTCIKVWDIDYANNNWSDKIDATATFSADCNAIWTIEVDDKTQTILDSVPGLDANNDGNITIAEAEAFVGELDLSDKNLEDIKGLQAFSGIKKLNLSGNNIKDLSPLTRGKITLVSKTTGKKREVAAKSSGLETLIISNNSFETLNLEELKNLKVIDLSNNPNVATISIKNGNNANITSFDATNCPNLTCIIVDDKNANYLANFNKDANSKFVADTADCRKEILNTEDFLQKDVKVFPNPVTNFLTIESTKEFDSIEIYNTIGKRILKTTARKIDFSNYKSGIYMMRIIAENKVLTKKVIKN